MWEESPRSLNVILHNLPFCTLNFSLLSLLASKCNLWKVLIKLTSFAILMGFANWNWIKCLVQFTIIQNNTYLASKNSSNYNSNEWWLAIYQPTLRSNFLFFHFYCMELFFLSITVTCVSTTNSVTKYTHSQFIWKILNNDTYKPL